MSQTLSQSIADTLRKAIQHGTYMCGDRLVELTLSQELDVSQNTIRDALHILEQEGWVHKIPRRGVYIPTFTVTEAEEIYALWQALESLALSWTLETLSDTDCTRLRETMISAEHKVDRQEWVHASYMIHNLHTAIGSYANAPRTQTILGRIHNQAQLLETQRQRFVPLNQDEWDNRIEIRFELLHEIDQRNTDKALHYLKRTIQYEEELVIPFLE
jgi:DNA-binding GntR family transcriptional regulator